MPRLSHGLWFECPRICKCITQYLYITLKTQLLKPKPGPLLLKPQSCKCRSPVNEWQVSWFVLGTITLNGTDATVKRLARNVTTFTYCGQFGNICNQRCLYHSKLLSPKQTSWPATLLLETGTLHLLQVPFLVIRTSESKNFCRLLKPS